MGSSSGIKNMYIYILYILYLYILSSQAPPMTPVTMGERERAREKGGGIENGKQHGFMMHRTY